MPILENADTRNLQTELQPSSGRGAAERRYGGRFEWLWRRRTLSEARERVTGTPALEATRLQHARRALELGDRALDPIDQLRSGSSVGLALSLYREAAYWALLALNQTLSARDLHAAIEQADPELLRAAASGDEALSRLKRALAENDFVATTQDSSDTQHTDAVLARDFVHALVDYKLEPEARVARVVMQRWTRVGFVGLSVLAIGLGSWVGVSHLFKGPDLAAGKPWRASSTFAACNLREETCNGVRVKIFFHTEEEDQPWVRFDLGRATRFAQVELVNRGDIGADRAYPIVIEVSDDGEKWREVSRRELPYSTWQAKFAPVKARYVRARLLKHTWFHLERFRVYAQ